MSEQNNPDNDTAAQAQSLNDQEKNAAQFLMKLQGLTAGDKSVENQIANSQLTMLQEDDFKYDRRACCCFSYKNTVRVLINQFVFHKYFDNFISLCILVNSIMLGMRDYDHVLKGADFKSDNNEMLEQVGKVFNIIFLIEMVLKMAAMGVFWHKESYLRDSWNRLDCFIVIISVMEFFPQLETISFLKVLRTLRILRPLRSINKFPRMKTLINSLLRSIPGLCQVFAFLMFILSVFGIFAVHQFMGDHYLRCRVIPFDQTPLIAGEVGNPASVEQQPPSWQWEVPEDAPWICSTDDDCRDQLKGTGYEGNLDNVRCGALADHYIDSTQDEFTKHDAVIFFDIAGFEDFIKAMFTVFTVITLEGWSLMMMNYSDAGQPIVSPIFFILVVILGAFFALNLVLAEVMESFERSKESEEGSPDELDPEKVESTQVPAAQNDVDIQEVKEENSQRDLLDSAARVAGGEAEPNLVEGDQDANQSKDGNMEGNSDALQANKIASAASERFDEEVQDYAARKRADTNALYGCFYKLVSGHVFNFFVFCLILGNTATLAVDGYPTNPKKAEIIARLNDFFTWIFFAEMCCKLIGLGFKNYFRDSYNCFDSVVVALSIVDWIINIAIDQDDIGAAAEGLKALKALRLLRMIKLAKSWTALTEIIKKTFLSVVDLTYVFVVMFLFIYIAALLGMEMFANQCKFRTDLDDELILDVTAHAIARELLSPDNPNYEAPRENFDNAANAITTVFIVTLGEDWPGVMYNYTRVYNHSWLVMLYFVITYSIGNFMLLSLFTAVLLENFNDGDDDGDSDAKEDEEELNLKTLPNKTFCMKCRSFGRSLKLEYYRAFSMNPRVVEQVKSDNQTGEEKDIQILRSMKVEPDTNQVGVEPEGPWGSEPSEIEMKAVSSEERSEPSEESEQDDEKFIKQLTSGNVVGLLKGMTLRTNHQKQDQLHKSMIQKDGKVGKMFTQSQMTLTHLNFMEKPDQTVLESERQKLREKIQGTSLWCLKKENKCREKLYFLILNKWFDRVILMFIVISTILLAVESPLLDPSSTLVKMLGYMDYCMTAIFFLEMCIKITALGFYSCGPGSYIQNGWNVLDFIIVLSALFSIAFQDYDLSALKALRLLRILRPLRLISRNKALKLAITSLINSVPDIINLLLITNFFIFMLAIFCTTFLAGKFGRCNTEYIDLEFEYFDGLVTTKWDCLNLGGEWENPDLNFDNTAQSMLTLMTIQTTEGWIGVMWDSVDAVGIDMEPERDYNQWYIVFYFFLIVIICMLFLNLFVGIVCDTYNNEKGLLMCNHMLSDNEKSWILVKLMAYQAKPQLMIRPQEQNKPCRNFFIRLVLNPVFETFIMIAIVLNTLTLACQWFQMDQGPLEVLDSFNYVFMTIFIVEAILKLIAMKMLYFKDPWNVFDFVVIVSTILVLVIAALTPFDIRSQATIIRILRLLRMLKIIKRFEKLQMIFQTCMEAIPAMGSMSVLLLLFLFLFSTIGMQTFSLVMLQGDLNRQFNFQTFFSSFLLLIRSATGEGWNTLMFDTARTRSITFQCDPNATWESINQNEGVPNGCGSPIAILFFLLFLFMVAYIFLNLFIAIVVDTYLGMSNAFNLPIKPCDVEIFVLLWSTYDPTARGFIAIQDLPKLLKDLDESETDFFTYIPDQIKGQENLDEFLIQLNLPCYNKFRDYSFYDVLLLMCRENCMFALYPEAKKQKITEKLSRVFKKRKLEMTEEKLFKYLNRTIYEKNNFKEEFNKLNPEMNSYDERIDLVEQLKKQSDAIGRRANKQIDTWKGADEWNGLYSSKHVVYALKISRIWRKKVADLKARRQSEGQSKQEQEYLETARKTAVDKQGQEPAIPKPGQTAVGQSSPENQARTVSPRPGPDIIQITFEEGKNNKADPKDNDAFEEAKKTGTPNSEVNEPSI